MDLIVLLLVLVIIAVLAYHISGFIPDPTLRTIVQLIILLLLVFYFARQTNLIPNVLR